MLERLTSTSPFARVLRVVLVFALVFWSSFNVEMLAFAAMYADSGAGHEPGTLSNLAVWEVQKAKEVNEKGETVDTLRPVTQMRDVHDTAAGEEQKAKPELQVNGSMQFVALPTWVAKPTVPDDPSQGGADPNPDNPDNPSQGGTNPDEPNPDNPNPDNPNPENPNPDNPNPDNPGTDTPSPETPNPEEPAPENPNPEQPNNSGNAAQTQAMPAATRSMPAAGQTDQGLTAQADDSTNGASSPAAEKPKEDVVIADFVEWKVGEGEEEIATVKVENGVATLTAHKAGKVTVTCSLKETANNLVAAAFVEEFPDKPFEASFTVTITKPQAPYVDSIELYTPDGALYKTTDPVTIPKDQANSYALYEIVNVVLDPTANPRETTSYKCTDTSGLSAKSGGRFSNLTWRAENPDGSEADKDDIAVSNGVITLKGNDTYTVWCISSDGPDGLECSKFIKVRLEGAVEDVQGPYNPQNELTVQIDVPTAEPIIPGDSADGADSNGNGGITTQAEGDSSGASTPSDGEPSSSGSSSNKESSATSDDASSDAAGKVLKSTSKTYSLEDLKPITEYNKEYQMGDLRVVGTGPTLLALIEKTINPDFNPATDSSKKAVQELPDIESIEFVIAGGEPINVPYGDLKAVSQFDSATNEGNVMLASESRVLTGEEAGISAAAAEGEETGASQETGSKVGSDAATDNASAPTDGTVASGPSVDDQADGRSASANESASESSSSAGSGGAADDSSTQLLPNTRFRLLYHGLGAGELANPNSFRSINRIIVHVKVEKPDQDPEIIRPYVEYYPERDGEETYLSPAIPKTLLDKYQGKGRSAGWNYVWQWSADGINWSEDLPKTDTDFNSQLKVMTNSDSVGTYRRFIWNVSYNDESGEKKTESIESTAVKIEYGKGFNVKLTYIPVVAGETAVFRAYPSLDPNDDEKVNLSEVYYEWQMSEDGGATWIGRDNPQWPQLLKDQSGVQSTTLYVPTKKIEEKEPGTDGGAEGGEGDTSENNQPLILIRVMAHYNGKKKPSNRVQLEVFKEPHNGGKADEVQKELETVGTDANVTDVSIVPDTEPIDIPTGPSAQYPVEQPTPDDPVQEQPTDPAGGSSNTPTSGARPTTEPTPMQPLPSEIHVNDAVTEQIRQQQEEAKNKPGARWTELSNVNPTDEDIKHVLGVNPFAPFAVPTALGLTVAGGLEKLIGFRRQTR